MKRWSAMGSSKYEFNPNQLDIDIRKKEEHYNKKKDSINKQILSMLESEPEKMNETFSIILDVLREWKLING